MDMKRILQALDTASTQPVEGANDMSKFLRIIKEADLNQQAAAAPAPAPAASTLSPEQIAYNQLRAQLDSADALRAGGTYTDVSPEVTASTNAMRTKLAQMAAALKAKGIDAAAEYDAPDPAVPAAAPVDLNQKYTTEETGMSRLLSIISEGTNPHKVALPVQMAMNHYQSPKEQPAPRAPSLLRKYFTEAEDEVTQAETDRKERLRMYSQRIAERVLVKESALKDKEDLQSKRKALQDIQLDPHTHKDPELKAELARRKAALEKEAKNKKLDEIAGAFPSPSTKAKWAADAAASNAAEAKRQEQLKAQQLQKNTAEVDRLQKINHHSLDAEIPAKEGVVDTVKSVATKVGDTIANAVPKEFRPFDNETAAKNQQSMKEAPIEMTGDANDPVVHGHQKANPMSLKGRIQQARNQLKELANMAESDDLAVWQQICQLSKGGMFMGLEQNIEQVRHGIEQLAAKRKQGGVASRGIDKNISERSVSQAQARTMAAAAHNPEFAKKTKIKPSVAKEFNQADKGKNIKSLPQRVTKKK